MLKSMKRGFLDIGIARAGQLVDRGATLEGNVVKVDAASDCQSPVGFSHTFTASTVRKPYPHEHARSDISFWLDGEARCRRCEACLAYRRKMWTARAMRETKAASRTWFGTLTVNPTTRTRYLMTAREKLRATSLMGADFEELSQREQFTRIVRELNIDLTLFLKRLRAQSNSRIRYLFAVERHKSGDPHLHALVHEVDPALPVRGRDLATQWQALGFTQWRLVKTDVGEGWKAPYYVCKYLAKDALARVRASVSYGEPPRTVVTDGCSRDPYVLDTSPSTKGDLPDPQAHQGNFTKAGFRPGEVPQGSVTALAGAGDG